MLDSQPNSDVVITPTSTQLQWSVPSITFTTTNWNVPQSVTLEAIDDSFDEPDGHPGTLAHNVTSVSDPGDVPALTVVDATASIDDNDTSDLVITPSSGLSVDEFGALPPGELRAQTFTSEPTAPITVTFGFDATPQVATSVPSIILNSSNWNTGVSVDVTAINDPIDEALNHNGTITHTMSGGDANFDGESGPDQIVDILDDDDAAVIITPTAGSTDVAEDGSVNDTYNVRLQTQPTADVTITLDNADGRSFERDAADADVHADQLDDRPGGRRCRHQRLPHRNAGSRRHDHACRLG